VELALDVLAGGITGPASSWFQSLFSWNLILMAAQPGGEIMSIQFQSLFSWNLLLMVGNAQDHSLGTTFQSLFSWNLLLMPPREGVEGRSQDVSILVFVELALDGWKVGSESTR